MWPNNNQHQQQQWRGVPPGVPPPPMPQQQQQQFNPQQQMNIGVVGGQAMGYDSVTNQGQVNPYQAMNQQPPQHQMIQNRMIQNQMIPSPHMQQVQHQQQQLPPNVPGQMNNYGIPPPSFPPPPLPPQPPMNIPPMNQMQMGPNNAGANQMHMRFPPPPPQPPPNIHLPPPNIPQNNNNTMHMNRNNHYGPSKPDNHYGPSKSIDSNHYGPSKNRNNHYGPSKSGPASGRARGQPRHENGSDRHKKKALKRNKGLEQHLKGERHRRNVEAKTANVLNVSSSEKHNGQAAMRENPQPFFCEICNITCQSIESYQQHMNGSGHKKQVEKMKNPNEGFHCQICNVHCSNEYSKQQHIRGKKHKKKAASLGISDDELADSIVSVPTQPPVKPVKEMKSMVSKPLADEEESDEEGEIDEEKEEIDNLYGEIEKSESTNLQDADHEEEKEDSDADDMFGDDGDGELEAGHSLPTTDKSISSQVKDESVEQQEDETDMFGEDDEESQSSETKQQPDDNGEIDQDMKCEIMEMYGEDDVESDSECNFNKWSKKLKQIDKAGSQQPVKKKAKQEVKEVKQEALGFVLDYTPATSVDVTNDNTEKQEPSSGPSEGFILDYSPDTSVESITNNIEQSSNVASTFTTPQEQLQKEGDDDDDMFGSEEEDNSPQGEDITLANPASGVLTAADALAAARSRSTREQPVKRAKISAQRHVKIPGNISQFDSTHKRSYYPPIHSDKYWSELRSWDFIKDLNEMKKREDNTIKETGTKRPNESNENEKKQENEDSLPDVFDSVAQYKALWAPLLINEAKAQLLSDVSSTQTLNGLAVKVELSNHQSSSGEGYNSSDQTVVVRISGDGAECPPINTNDIVLFVHQSLTIDQAFQGKAFEAFGGDELPKGRLGLIGHAVNQRARGSVDGLLVRVTKNIWTPFSTLKEMFLFRIGSNVTANREFKALSTADEISLTKYLLDGGKASSRSKAENGEAAVEKSTTFDPISAEGGKDSLPVGFRIFIKSKMNISQLHAITASASEYGDGGLTLIKGPPGTGKSTTLVSILNALHLKQYQEYYNAIEKIITGSTASTYYEELAALNKACEVKPRILVCAPSNSGIDNIVLKIMSDKFVDGQGGKYSPNIVRVGSGITNSKCDSVGLKRRVDAIIEQGSNMAELEQTIVASRQTLKRFQKEIHKLRARIIAMVECCPYAISNQWEIRIDEASFDSSGRVVFVNHAKKTTTFDVPGPKKRDEASLDIHSMPHYRSLLKNLTKYVERHNNETSNLEKHIIVQNAAAAKLEGASDESLVPLLETHVLNSTHIVLTTLGSSGGRVVKSANKFKVIVVDEAAQSSEPATLVALQLGSSHAILVGDPQQLPATIFSVSGRVTKYDRSLFQRLEEAGHPVHLLNTQYRMHPAISEFPRHIFYDGKLLDAPNVLKPDYGGNLKTIIRTKLSYIQPFNILDLESTEERQGNSLSNKSEAELVLQLYRTLDVETNGFITKESRVAIITPYSQQKALLHRLFNERYGNNYQTRVEISTVDAFQGREANIVLYSCVRAGGSGGIGFLSDVQRMNVALTRAKNFLFVIANCSSITVNPYWRNLVEHARSKNAIIQVPFIPVRPKITLKSALIKSPISKSVSFGAVEKKVYDINSMASSDREKVDLFPDLTKLAPQILSKHEA